MNTMKNWLLQIGDFFRRLFSTKKSAEENGTATEMEMLDRKLFDKYSITDDEDTLLDKIQMHILASGQYYTDLGTRDGKSGTRNFNIYASAKIHATLIANRINSVLQGLKDGLEFLKEEKRKELDILLKKIELNEISVGYHNDQKTSDNAKYNGWNALIYVLFGLGMIFSDVKISNSLMTQLGISGQTSEEWSTFDLYSFSIGIALSTILFKILYDEYVNSNIGKLQMAIVRSSAQGANKWWLRVGIVIRILLQLLIALGLIALLWNLAEYRSIFTVYYKAVELDTIKDKLTNTDIAGIIRLCYIGLTVIVPIVGGISLSAGFRIIHDRSALRFAEKLHRKHDRKKSKLQEEVKYTKYKLAKITRYGIEWSAADRIELQSSFLTEHYNQGFRVSYRENHGNDLYRLVEEYRNEAFNYAVTEKLKSKKL